MAKKGSRTLEEALAGVPTPYPTRHCKSNKRQINKKTGRLRPPAQSPYTKGKRKRPDSWMARINPKHPNYCPELAKKHYLMIQANGRKGAAKRVGLPEGYRHAEWQPIWEVRQQRAAGLVQTMKDKGMIDTPVTKDDERAETAMEFAVAVIISPEYGVKDRLAAANTVLKYTKQAPAAKQDVTLHSAEAFLAALVTEE